MRFASPDLIGTSYATKLSRAIELRERAMLDVCLSELNSRQDAGSLTDRLVSMMSHKFVNKLASSMFDRVDTFNRTQLARVIAIDLFADADLSALAMEFAKENARLVKTNNAALAESLASIMHEAVGSGRSWRDVAPELQARFEISKRHARLIARDQVGKLYTDITQARQEEAGVTEYIWRTARDPRVRDDHRSREGKTFSWSNPPSGDHPGQAILCRCYAEPVLN